MNYKAIINANLEPWEVPKLREKVGWGPREYEYPALLERCNFYAAIRSGEGELIGFGYICGMGLEHGYMEDIMVDPAYQRQGLGTKLVKRLLEEAKQRGILIVSVNLDPENERFYRNCGFEIGLSGTVVY